MAARPGLKGIVQHAQERRPTPGWAAGTSNISMGSGYDSDPPSRNVSFDPKLAVPPRLAPQRSGKLRTFSAVINRVTGKSNSGSHSSRSGGSSEEEGASPNTTGRTTRRLRSQMREMKATMDQMEMALKKSLKAQGEMANELEEVHKKVLKLEYNLAAEVQASLRVAALAQRHEEENVQLRLVKHELNEPLNQKQDYGHNYDGHVHHIKADEPPQYLDNKQDFASFLASAVSAKGARARDDGVAAAVEAAQTEQKRRDVHKNTTVNGQKAHRPPVSARDRI